VANEQPVPAQPPLWRRILHPKLRDAVKVVGGMVLGTLVGVAVQSGLRSTGLMGPGVDALIAEQKSNFTEVNGKLDALRKVSSDPAAQRTLSELSALLQKQNTLSQQTEQQLKLMASEMSASKDRDLAEHGVAGGADFWLKVGESYNLAARDQVFALQAYGQGIVQVSLNGNAKRLRVGEVVEFMAGGRACKVFYKQATPRQDGRVGFDLDCK
jgi:uncharacterized coiled-coil protein SlyX